MFLAIFLSLYGLALNEEASSYFGNFFRFSVWERIFEIFYFSFFTPHFAVYFSYEIQVALELIGPWLSCLYVLLTLWLLKKWRAYGLMFFLILSWLTIICVMVFNYSWPGPRHYSFCLMYTVMVLWIGKVGFQTTKTIAESLLGVLFVVAFLCGVLGTVVQAYRDLSLPFSGSKRMAEYLIEHKLDNKTFVVNGAMMTISILPYLPKVSLWDPRRSEAVRYFHFEPSLLEELTISEVFKRMKRKFISSGPVYFISDKPVVEGVSKRLRLLYSAKGWYEEFFLYLVVAPRKGFSVGQ
ncbi:MAG: hypothetical protein HQL21_08015 [Candidatus Omnitrophica bacterium]|nr:hypothetical protein [Candidatus Omnitrophota bacterium]